MAYNLDFSNWVGGNRALASSMIDSATTRAQAKAAQTSGLTAGIGAIIGAIYGGPAGAAEGYKIGGALSGNPNADRYSTTGKEFGGTLTDDWSDPFGREADKKKKKETPTEGMDLMQLASSMNMIDENGNIKPAYLEYIQSIGKAA